MRYILFGLIFFISFLAYSAAVVRTDYDCIVDDEEQERYLDKRRQQ